MALFAVGVSAADAPRFEASFQTTYTGTHPDLFAQQQDRVRLLLHQAQLEISSQLGLMQYQQGFRCPLTVRFDDAPSPGAENALAYVRIVPAVNGFGQELVVNLDVMAGSSMDFDRVFYHEMTHAVLNDSVVSAYGKALPSWVQEGLAVYIAGDGDARVKRMAQRVHQSQASVLVRDLTVPALDYPRDYLAFKYMVTKQSINTLQAFVRDLTEGKTPEDAVEDSTGMSWDAYRQALQAFSLSEYQANAHPDLGQ